MIISRDYYQKMHDHFHPRFHDFIQTYVGLEEDLIMVPRYHGCGLKNKNRVKKLIDYRNGEQCDSPVWSNGKEFADSRNDGSLTRYMSFYGNGTLRIKEIQYLIIKLISSIICWTLQTEIILRDFFN